MPAELPVFLTAMLYMYPPDWSMPASRRSLRTPRQNHSELPRTRYRASNRKPWPPAPRELPFRRLRRRGWLNRRARRLYRAASVGYLGNHFNAQFGLAVRIGALRRSAPTDSPPASVLVDPPRSSPSSSSRARSRPSCHSRSSPPWGVAWWVPLIAVAVMTGVFMRSGRPHATISREPGAGSR